jgi:hypothetical protein
MFKVFFLKQKENKVTPIFMCNLPKHVTLVVGLQICQNLDTLLKI